MSCERWVSHAVTSTIGHDERQIQVACTARDRGSSDSSALCKQHRICNPSVGLAINQGCSATRSKDEAATRGANSAAQLLETLFADLEGSQSAALHLRIPPCSTT